MGDSYKKTKSKKLKIKPLNREATYAQNTGGTPVKMTPIYCVVFDKGTQVVAATRAYFLK